MEYASDAYKEAMKANVRGKSYVWISLDLTNYYAQDTAYVSSSFSGSEDSLYNDAPMDEGVTSTESDGSITFTFGEYTTLLLSGLRFTLNDFEGTITATNGTTSKTVTVSEDEVVVEQEFNNCSYIKLTPNSGHLNIRRVKFGTFIEFENEDIMTTNRENKVKHLNDELPLKEFSFTVHNYARRWNRDNPESVTRFLQERQPITYKYGRQLLDDSIYVVDGGVVYLKTWQSDDYKASFSGVGFFDYLTSEYKKGSIFPSGVTLYQLAEFVLIDAGITKYELDAVLRTFKVTNPLPIDTHKACLQIIAHAGQCVLYEDRNGAVCLKSVNRPEFIKTAKLTDATNFSAGYDVVNPLTVANYGSTEPNYTLADGLHYFYPESETHEEVDTSVNYMPYPYYDSAKAEYGITYTLDGRSITAIGQTENYFSQFFIIENESEIPIAKGKYVLCDAQNPQQSKGNGNKYTIQLIIKNGEGTTSSRTSSQTFDNRVFEVTDDNTSIYYARFYVNSGNSVNDTFYPGIYKIVEVNEEPKDTYPVGFVSEEFANASGGFSTTPKIDIEFVSPCVLTALIMNCAVAPSDFSIRVSKEGSEVASESVTNNTSPQFVLSFDYANCDKIEISFTKTTPYQRIHVNSVEFDAEIDYEITYHDMTSTPVATSIDALSTMEFELTTYTELTDTNKSRYLGYPTITYTEIEGGGLWADINTGSTALAYIEVKQGINEIELSSPSVVSSAQYVDDIEGGTITILESGAYYVKLQCSRDGTANILGTEYMENTESYYIDVNEIGNPVKISNPLISTKEHADRLRDWFLDYYSNDIEYSLTYRGDPVIDADDSVFLENQFVDKNLVRIESEELSTSAGMDTNNRIVARRRSYSLRDKTVLKDFVISNTIIYLQSRDTERITVVRWIPDTALDKTVTWSSSNTSVATVDSNGVVTAAAGGTAVITATSSNGITHSCTINVIMNPDIVADFTLSSYAEDMQEGDTVQLSVTEWVPDTALHKAVTWSSSNQSVATVDDTGLVEAVANGAAQITATCPDGVSKSCAIRIGLPSRVSVSLNRNYLNVGETATALCSITPVTVSDQRIAWSVENPTVLSISPSTATAVEGRTTATVTALRAGTSRVVATYVLDGSVYYSSSAITVL